MKKKQAKKVLRQVESHYDAIAGDFSKTRQKAWYEFEVYKELVANKMQVLDVGCGNGRLYWHALKGREVKYKGIDISKGLLKEAASLKSKLKSRSEKLRVQFQHGRMHKLPFSARNFDRLFCVAAFHHLPTRELRLKTLKEFKRVTKKDGLVVISVWNLFQKKFRKYIWVAIKRSVRTKFAFAWNDTLFDWQGSTGDLKKEHGRYYHAFTPWEMRTLIRDAGFELVEELYMGKKVRVEKWWQAANMVWIIRKI